MSVELASDEEEESQTLGIGTLIPAFPLSLARVSPVGRESKSNLDSSVPAHIRRPELPSRATEGAPKLPVELELDLGSVEHGLISRSTPEESSDSDTDRN